MSISIAFMRGLSEPSRSFAGTAARKESVSEPSDPVTSRVRRTYCANREVFYHSELPHSFHEASIYRARD